MEVNFTFFIFFFSIIMYANEFETKEKQKSTKIEN